jgi:hypothetical protein
MKSFISILGAKEKNINSKSIGLGLDDVALDF